MVELGSEARGTWLEEASAAVDVKRRMTALSEL
jgi:hypothetical protein